MAIVGGGRIGSALAQLLASRGWGPRLWTRRSREGELPGVRCLSGEGELAGLRDAALVVVAVRDQAITTVAAQLQRAWRASAAPRCVAHVSGATPAARALAPLADVASVATMHPLLAVSSPEEGVKRLGGAYWTLEGHDMAVRACAEMLAALDARCVRLGAEDLALYHACAVIASNHAVALWTAARDQLQQMGSLDPTQATEMLLPLLASTLDNVRRFGLPEALTGPVRRGDGETIRSHLATLAERAPQLLASYRADAALARAGLAAATDPGLDLASNLATLAWLDDVATTPPSAVRDASRPAEEMDR